MFKTIEKAKHVGVIALERVRDYIALIRLEIEIQRRVLVKRVLSMIVAAALGILALIFLAEAILVTLWDTPYRNIAAWGVGIFWALTACLAYFAARHYHTTESLLTPLSYELEEDIKLLKELM